jgi:glycosyltransferase involved in cell wall biosynthesis
MRIGIYAESAKERERRGVGYHVLNLIQGLAAVDTVNEYLLYYQIAPFERDSYAGFFPAQANVRPRPVRFPSDWTGSRPNLWLNRYLPWVIHSDRVDVFHSPNHFLPAIAPDRTVVTIHDLAYFDMQLYERTLNDALCVRTMAALDMAARVIAISNSTRMDIEKLGIDAAKIRLIYAGGGHIVPESQIEYPRMDELRRAFSLPEHYILFVGTVGIRKNLQFLVRSYAELKRTTALPHKLVLVGKKLAGLDELEQLIRELGLVQDVILTDYVEAWQLPLFYKMADLFVLPTLYEGFGLIALEAMAYGLPVVATNTSAIPEVTGDAATLVPLNDVPALTRAMRGPLEDATLRATMIARGLEQAKKFTWEHCARETVALYHEVHDRRLKLAS